MAGDSKEKNDEGKKNLLLTTLQVGFDFKDLLQLFSFCKQEKGV